MPRNSSLEARVDRMSLAVNIGGEERLLLYGTLTFVLGFLDVFGSDDTYKAYVCSCLVSNCQNVGDIERLVPDGLKELYDVVHHQWCCNDDLPQDVTDQAIDKGKLKGFIALWWEAEGEEG